MLDDLVISGLTKRRAILAGEIVHIEKQLKQKLFDLKAIDAAIKVFDEDYPIDTIRPKGLYTAAADWKTRGELSRLIFQMLHESPKALSSRDIALQVMAHKQMDTSRQRAVVLMRRRVGEALRRKQLNGLLRCCKQPGEPLLWELVTPLLVASSPSTSCSPDA
jgi:hypothetical protein